MAAVVMTWVSSFLLPLLTRDVSCLCASLWPTLLLPVVQQELLMPFSKSLFGGRRSVGREVGGVEDEGRRQVTVVRVEVEEEKEGQDEQDEEPGGRGALQPGARRASWPVDGCRLDVGRAGDRAFSSQRS